MSAIARCVDDPSASAFLFPPVPRTWFSRPADELARELIGLTLVHQDESGGHDGSGRVAAVIVETEAYGGPEDRASHARAGLTRRTAPMFGPSGHAYVYRIYGLHWCLNVVAASEGVAGAVLIRAIAPFEGLAIVRSRRERPGDPDVRLSAGPARVCQALAVDGSLDGHDLTRGQQLWISDPDPQSRKRLVTAGIVSGPRIGVAYAGPDWSARAWRFGLRDHPALSRSFPR